MDIQLLIQNCVHNRIKFFLNAGDFLPQHGRKKDQLSLLENKYSNKVLCAASQYIMKVSKYIRMSAQKNPSDCIYKHYIEVVRESNTDSFFYLFL